MINDIHECSLIVERLTPSVSGSRDQAQVRLLHVKKLHTFAIKVSKLNSAAKLLNASVLAYTLLGWLCHSDNGDMDNHIVVKLRFVCRLDRSK